VSIYDNVHLTVSQLYITSQIVNTVNVGKNCITAVSNGLLVLIAVRWIFLRVDGDRRHRVVDSRHSL